MAVLARRVGLRHLELVEDAVQSALLAALSAWSNGPPENKSAWLFTVANNRLLQDLRQNAGRSKLLEQAASELEEAPAEPVQPHFTAEVTDDLLRMLFVCCDEAIPRESQLVLALKTLCGFSVPEIALRLFTSEANVRKRLTRARERLREALPDALSAQPEQLRSRLGGVHTVLYLLFNEGYLSARAEHAIRRELCEEAIRLATLLAEHAQSAAPTSSALLALMHLHLARLGARTDASGGLLLLEEQDRSVWDREEITLGMVWLQRSAQGSEFSRFHAEAGIAAEHCLAPSFALTRWDEIADLYRTLELGAPSPLHTLNRAVAVAEQHGAAAGLAVLQQVTPPSWLIGSYLWDAVLADLHRRAGHREIASQHRERALASAPTEAVRDLLKRRLISSS